MSEALGNVLVVDDEQDLAESCAFFLRRNGYRVRCVGSGEEAVGLLRDGAIDLVITDLKMPRMSGIELLGTIKGSDPDVEVVVITGFPEVETAVEAMKLGALDYLTKPFNEDALMQRVEKAFAHRQVTASNAELKQRLRAGAKGRLLTWVSDEFRATIETVEKAARTDASVLILGSSGTGKELLAHHLHDSSRRAERPFVPIDCATMPENLIESELFGHVKGAFSGAESNKMGLFQVADGGTLFLDEVGELPLPFQTKLLRAIQERKIRRVGGNDIVEVDVRIVAATNRDLQTEVDAGRFRPDLFYRLDVVRIDVPALADRRADIRPLAETFLEEFRAHSPNCVVERFAPDAIATMEAFDWPGNVRQLRNVVERVCALCSKSEVVAADLPKDLGVGATETPREAEPFQEMKARKIAAIESSYLVGLLREHAGNVTRCAKEAGMSRSAFQKIMQRYGIRSSDYRPD